MSPDIVTIVLTALTLAVVCRTVWSVLDQPPQNTDVSQISRQPATAGRPPAPDLNFHATDRPDGRTSSLTDEIARQIENVRAIDHSFEVDTFLNDSCIIYECIVEAFASGDRRRLRDLLSPAVYNVFEHEIDAREEREYRAVFSFICLKTVNIFHAHASGSRVEISIRFISEVVSAILDPAGNAVVGNPAKVVEMHDRWTFAREMHSRGRGWQLIETQ